MEERAENARAWLIGMVIGLLAGALLGPGELLGWAAFAIIVIICLLDLTPIFMRMYGSNQYRQLMKSLVSLGKELSDLVKSAPKIGEAKEFSDEVKAKARELYDEAEGTVRPWEHLPAPMKANWYAMAENDMEAK